MRVVLTQNLERDKGLVNGTQGTVIRFDACDIKQLPGFTDGYSAVGFGPPRLDGRHAAYRHCSIKEFVHNNKCGGEYLPWPVVKFDNGQERTIYADCAVDSYGQGEPYSLLSRTQIPLVPGYAITIHKSQLQAVEPVYLQSLTMIRECRLIASLLIFDGHGNGAKYMSHVSSLKNAIVTSALK